MKHDINSTSKHTKDYDKDRKSISHYFNKMKGGEESPPMVSIHFIIWAWVGTFCAILFIVSADIFLKDFTERHPLLLASMGASTVMIFGAPSNEYSQPRNVILGHFVSALVGVTSFQLFGANILLGAAFAVSMAVTVMLLTKSLHPPGGATALLAVIGNDGVHELGYWFVLTPCTSTATILVVLGVLFNNIVALRKYPRYWW